MLLASMTENIPGVTGVESDYLNISQVKLPQLYKSVHAVDPKSKSEFVSILKV
jgi:hypothetical protein